MTAMPKTIDLDGVRRLSAEGAQLLDVMGREEFEESHLPGAINIPLPELDEETTAQLDRGRPIIAYCADFE
jgi:rhodanese-related sulfurtransferase